jgi:hypothetical protein
MLFMLIGYLISIVVKYWILSLEWLQTFKASFPVLHSIYPFTLSYWHSLLKIANELSVVQQIPFAEFSPVNEYRDPW